jgi:hypothetical protein
MGIELFVFLIVAFCGLCTFCGFYIAKRLYTRHDTEEIWECICTKCYSVRHSYQPLTTCCSKCGESKIAYHKVSVG